MTGRVFEVGDELGPLKKPPVTKTQLVMYSGASLDFNPIHTVEEFAKEVGLGGVIAHGMLTMAFVGQMLTDVIGMDGFLEKFEIRFTDMVRPGDVVVCHGRVKELEPIGDLQRVQCDIWAEVEGTSKTVVSGQACFVARAS